MSVIQRIRDRGAWIISSLIALALIAFILQDRGTSRGGMFTNTTTLGKINGKAVEFQEFNERVESISKRGYTRENIIPQLWDEEVTKAILQGESDKLGLVCTTREWSDALFNPQSQFMQQYFTDPKTGQVDVDKARQAVNQLKKSKNQEQVKGFYEGYVEPLQFQALQMKYQALIDHSSYVPKWMIEQQQKENSMVSSVSFVNVPYTTISDSTVKVSDDEIMAYANKHKKEYERTDETRGINYVTFDASASAADSEAVRTDLQNLKTEFTTTADMPAFISKAGSEMTYYDGFISKKEIKQPVKDTLFKLAVGGVFGPYVDGKNYVMARLVAEKTIPDTVKVRHILVGTEQRDQQTGAMTRIRDDSSAKRIADSIAVAIKGGANFDSLLAKYSDDAGSKDKGGVYDNVAANGQMVSTFNDFMFGGKTGDKAVVKTEFGYHYMEILNQKGSGTGYKFAYLAKPIIISDQTNTKAAEAAASFAATSKSYKDFTANATKQNKLNLPAQNIKENDFNVQGIGTTRKLVSWIYNHDLGDINTEQIKIDDKYVVAIITSINKAGLPGIATLRPMVEYFVRSEKKAKQIIASKFKGNTLDSYAASAGVPVQKADSIFATVPFVAGIGGGEGKFMGAAFNASMKGKVTEPIAGNQGVYALRVENIGTRVVAGTDDATVSQRLMQAQKSAGSNFMEALKKAATIKNYMNKFYVN